VLVVPAVFAPMTKNEPVGTQDVTSADVSTVPSESYVYVTYRLPAIVLTVNVRDNHTPFPICIKPELWVAVFMYVYPVFRAGANKTDNAPLFTVAPVLVLPFVDPPTDNHDVPTKADVKNAILTWKSLLKSNPVLHARELY
jgi:hypothetical protein